jgi:hypothetical protein
MVKPGRGRGFSPEAPKGVRFLTRSCVVTDEEAAELDATRNVIKRGKIAPLASRSPLRSLPFDALCALLFGSGVVASLALVNLWRQKPWSKTLRCDHYLPNFLRSRMK